MQASLHAGEAGGQFRDAAAEDLNLFGELPERMVGEQLGLFEFLEAVGIHGDEWY